MRALVSVVLLVSLSSLGCASASSSVSRARVVIQVVCAATAGACLSIPSLAGAAGGSVPVRPGLGLLFEQYSAPLQLHVEGGSIGSKIGTATTHHIGDPFLIRQPLFTWGAASNHMAIEIAARDAGISEVRHVEYQRLSAVLGLYVRTTIVVYGD